jgi:N-methylhydantoinase A/oxoprolinase/acetone carboxylase beta subunit
MLLGIDVGGTHTDSVLLQDRTIVAKAKVATDTADILGSVLRATCAVADVERRKRVERIVLSTTVLTNAVAQDQLDRVGLVVMNGPGVAPADLPLAGETTIVAGYMNHRGIEAEAPNEPELNALADAFARDGIGHVAIVGKFSSRNPLHELCAAKFFAARARHVSLGHQLSGQLNFPRRIATAYLNEALWSLHARFVEQLAGYLAEIGIDVPLYILKADGGTIEVSRSRDCPVQTILSGPAASIMGVLPLVPTDVDCVSIDIGGTTTDIALFAHGAPLLQPQGADIGGHRTLVRGLLTRSMALGGDSQVRVIDRRLVIGPERKGSAMAFGGPCPTPTDALIASGRADFGDKAKAAQAMADLARDLGRTPEETATAVVAQACDHIADHVRGMVAEVNAKPVYTIHELLEGRVIAPKRLIAVGGPAPCMADEIGVRLGMPALVPPNHDVANACGAAMARTTVELNLVADTEAKIMSVAELGERVKIPKRFTDEDVIAAGRERLLRIAREAGAREEDLAVEVTDRQSFNVVRGQSNSGRNIRVRVQIKPGLTHAGAGPSEVLP